MAGNEEALATGMAPIEVRDVDRSVAERVERIIKAVADKDVGRRTKFLEAELVKLEDGVQEQAAIVERNRVNVTSSQGALDAMDEDDPMHGAMANDNTAARYHLAKAEGILLGLVAECETVAAQIKDLKDLAAKPKKAERPARA